MARRKQTRGACRYCGRELTRGGMGRHLATCGPRLEAIQRANEGLKEAEPIYHLQVQDAWSGTFWLHIEMPGSVTLRDLDRYLRAIWLECCGHLSRFSIGGWGGREFAMDTQMRKAFKGSDELTHIYDFGTSSETLFRLADVRQGAPTTAHPVTLMARNEMPEEVCMACERPARWLCIECVYEEEKPGTLCDVHVRNHPHHNYGDPMPILNSPRTGMCGYDGPAEPPY